jgi:Fe-S cluster biogenesis protein NfuA
MMPFEKIFINQNGECVICHEHRKKWLNKDYEQSEKELIRIINHYKKRNKHKNYDAIVAFSGGKDSVYALYQIKKKYGMRPLAVTGDNGLLTDRAIKNMKITVDKLGVDHIIVNQNHEELKLLYRAYFKKTKNFCEICYLTILKSLGEASIEYDVPLMITGFAFKIDSSHFRAERRYCFEDAFARIVKDVIPKDVYSKYITKNVRANNHFHLLHLFDYINHIDKEIYETLENEIGWDSNDKNDKHTDCRFHEMLGYLKYMNNDLTSLALMAPAALLRDEQITLDEFRELLKKQESNFMGIERNQLDDFLEYFDVEETFLTEEINPSQLAEPVIGEKDFEPLIQAGLQCENGIIELLHMLFDIIRPEINRDGGDIRILDYKDNILKIQMFGACRGCMIADQVMMRYIEFLVRKYVSNDIVIENVKEVAPLSDKDFFLKSGVEGKIKYEKCIALDDPAAWRKALYRIPHAFAHTWDNCYAMHLSTGYKTFLYTLEKNDIRVVCPIAERAYEGYVDIVTPYGFSGFVGNKPLPGFPDYWKKFTSERGYICGYIGLNPVLQNENYYQEDEIYYYNSVYMLDLTKGVDELFAGLSTNRKRQIKAAEGMNNITTEKGKLLEFLLTHYYEFYREKGASKVYQFKPDTIIELAFRDNVIIAGLEDDRGINAVILFAFTPYIGEYMLNISLPEGKRYSAALIWYGVKKLIEHNVQWLNLGGGIKPGDGVAKFKERFGGKVFLLSSLKQIYNHDVYRSLCCKANVNPDDLTGYFPLYRK